MQRWSGFGTIVAEGKETRKFDGQHFVVETVLHADVALIHAWKADRSGNLVFRNTAHNFNPACAMVNVWLQSENGLLGIGPFPWEDHIDADLFNAGKQTVTAFASASYFGSHDSYAMIRSGRIDLAILGAMQVTDRGDIAWPRLRRSESVADHNARKALNQRLLCGGT